MLDFPMPVIELVSSALAGRFLTTRYVLSSFLILKLDHWLSNLSFFLKYTFGGINCSLDTVLATSYKSAFFFLICSYFHFFVKLYSHLMWKSLSRVRLFATPWTIQSMEFSRPENTGVGSLSLLQGIFPTQGSNPGLPHCRWILYQLSHNHIFRKSVWKEISLTLDIKKHLNIQNSVTFSSFFLSFSPQLFINRRIRDNHSATSHHKTPSVI